MSPIVLPVVSPHDTFILRSMQTKEAQTRRFAAPGMQATAAAAVAGLLCFVPSARGIGFDDPSGPYYSITKTNRDSFANHSAYFPVFEDVRVYTDAADGEGSVTLSMPSNLFGLHWRDASDTDTLCGNPPTGVSLTTCSGGSSADYELAIPTGPGVAILLEQLHATATNTMVSTGSSQVTIAAGDDSLTFNIRMTNSAPSVTGYRVVQQHYIEKDNYYPFKDVVFADGDSGE